MSRTEPDPSGGRRVVMALAAMGLSTLLTMIVAEVGVRIWHTRAPSYDIEMWRYAREVKVPVERADRVFAHRPGADTQLYGARVRTVENGLRQDAAPGPGQAGVPRVLLLGDSITMGWGVAIEDIYASRLPALLGGAEVINTGVGAYNTVQEVATCEDIGLAYDPDAIVLGWFINDAEPLPGYAVGGLWARSRLLLLLWSRVDRARRLAGEDSAWDQFYADLYADGQPGWVAAQRALRRLAAIGREQGVPVLVAQIPELHQLGAHYPFRAQHALVADIAREEGMHVVDLTDRFPAEDPQSLWVSWEDAHPNAEGHRILAEGIAEALAPLLTAAP